MFLGVFLKYWHSLYGFNKLVIKVKIHAKTIFKFFLFFFCMKIWYEFFIFKKLCCMHENKIYFFVLYFFATFQWKSSILIPNLYLYDIKIQFHIKQNWYKKYAWKSQVFWKGFFQKCFGMDRTQPNNFGSDQRCLCGVNSGGWG